MGEEEGKSIPSGTAELDKLKWAQSRSHARLAAAPQHHNFGIVLPFVFPWIQQDEEDDNYYTVWSPLPVLGAVCRDWLRATLSMQRVLRANGGLPAIIVSWFGKKSVGWHTCSECNAWCIREHKCTCKLCARYFCHNHFIAFDVLCVRCACDDPSSVSWRHWQDRARCSNPYGIDDTWTRALEAIRKTRSENWPWTV